MSFGNSPPHRTCHAPALFAVLVAILLSACSLPVTVSLVWPTPLAEKPAPFVPPDTPTPFQPLSPTLQTDAELSALPDQSSTPAAPPQPLSENQVSATASAVPGVPTAFSTNPALPTASAPPPASAKISFSTATVPKPYSFSPTQTQPKISSPLPTRTHTQVLSPSPTHTFIPPAIPTATRSVTVPPPPPPASPAATATWTTVPPPPSPPPPAATATSVSILPTSPPAACAAAGNSGYEQTLLNLINQERTNQGLAALNWQSQLADAARLHSTDMSCNNFFSHTGSNGSTFDQRIRTQGYAFSAAAENLAAGGGPQDAFNGWMNSPGHRTNMLNPTYQEIGIGYMYNGGTTYGSYFTATFGAR